MNKELSELLALAETRAASDVHLSEGDVPRLRMVGDLVRLEDHAVLTHAQLEEIVDELGSFTLPADCDDAAAKVRAELLAQGSIDGAMTSPSGGRYRFNLYRESDRLAVALRRLDGRFRTFAELGLPPRLESFASERDGLVIVTGPTGSGKSTTLATLIDRINHTLDGHIITIEDPVEFIHRPARSLVHQRQVGRDTKSFNDALVEAMRQDPDVILVGEMRDLPTVRTALRAAETGHLVFSTLHAGDCAGAIERMISLYPADEQPGARHQLSLVLRGIVAQHLVIGTDTKRRHPAVEIMVNTSAVANLIANARSAQVYSQIEIGASQGMCTLEQSLAELVQKGAIDANSAFAISRNPSILTARLARKR